MPASIELAENNRVLLCVVRDPITLDELDELMEKAKVYFDQSPRTLHTLVDGAALTSVPNGVLRYRTSAFVIHPRSGYVTLATTSVLARNLMQMILRLSNCERGRFFTTLEEGWKFMHETLAAEDNQNVILL